MQEIRHVLRRKQAQYAQLAKEIELLQQAEEKLREVAPLLADSNEDEDSAVLAEVDEESGNAASVAAAGDGAKASGRPAAVRWP
jgi:hypothetical protein